MSLSKFTLCEKSGCYSTQAPVTEDDIILMAQKISEDKLASRPTFVDSQFVEKYVRGKIGGYGHEVFCVLFLDTKHNLIAFEEMFRGTIDGASVYPRDVIKRCLELNAGRMILAHNHPSGSCEPSQADLRLTRKLIEAASLMDINILDHVIVSEMNSRSMCAFGDVDF